MTATETVPTVLLVDDEPEMLAEYQELLDCYGIVAETCTNPLDAQAVLDRFPSLEVVVSDLAMDGMNGPDLFAHIRRSSAPGRTVGCILLTGAPEVGPELCGPDVPVFYKPVDIEALVAAIAAMRGGAAGR